MSDWINDRTVPHEVRHPLWHVVVPVKGGPAAKTRLRAPDGVDHPSLALALALDTVAAAVSAVGSPLVLVVTSDPVVAQAVRRLGVGVTADPGGGLNAAVTSGASRVTEMEAVPDSPDSPDSPTEGTESDSRRGPGIAVLLGDVPALSGDELRRALRAADEHRSAFVPDAEGTGTVLLTTRSAGEFAALTPRFGGGSARAHEQDGHARLDLDLPGLRRDVDDIESLQGALELGVGPHTARVLAHLVGPEALVGLDP